ncbi:hypothetical protein Scep_023709 [Stephania cephalantha]|uniref:Uncharacterized protein n=1 Tax=Stephania cephalantha TaxID=152367 RepID=A0AAP0EVN7_9MAGN
MPKTLAHSSRCPTHSLAHSPRLSPSLPSLARALTSVVVVVNTHLQSPLLGWLSSDSNHHRLLPQLCRPHLHRLIDCLSQGRSISRPVVQSARLIYSLAVLIRLAEIVSMMEKFKKTDQELKKRVLKLEFWVQEARSQNRKLQRGERREKDLKELRDQLAMKKQESCSNTEKQANFWESSGFKFVASMSMLVLVVHIFTKIDPYLNTDAGTMSPFEHGEGFVLDDGGESVIDKERKGDYLGKTVQVTHLLLYSNQCYSSGSGVVECCTYSVVSGANQLTNKTVNDWEKRADKLKNEVETSLFSRGAFPREKGDLHMHWKLVSKRLRNCQRCIVLPIGSLSMGLCRHRAILFKFFVDHQWCARIQLRASVVLPPLAEAAMPLYSMVADAAAKTRKP